MPVSLNEPLSALQRLCEEVQYSELLDEAAGLDHPCDRMVREGGREGEREGGEGGRGDGGKE